MSIKKQPVFFIWILKSDSNAIQDSKYCFSSLEEVKDIVQNSFPEINWSQEVDIIKGEFRKENINIKLEILKNPNSLEFVDSKNYCIRMLAIFGKESLNEVRRFCKENGLFAYDVQNKEFLDVAHSYNKSFISSQEIIKRFSRCIELSNRYRKGMILKTYSKATFPSLVFLKVGNSNKTDLRKMYREVMANEYDMKDVNSFEDFWRLFGLSEWFEKLVHYQYSDNDITNCICNWVYFLFDEKPDLKVLEKEIKEELIQTRQKLMIGGASHVSMAPWYSMIPEVLITQYDSKFKQLLKQMQLSRVKL